MQLGISIYNKSFTYGPARNLRPRVCQLKQKCFPAAGLEALKSKAESLASGPLISAARRHGKSEDICVEADAFLVITADPSSHLAVVFGSRHDLRTWQGG